MPANWTLMMYLDGDNNISQAQGVMLNNIKNAGSSNQVHVAVLIDQNQVGDTKLYYLNGTTLVQQTWPTESSMDDPATLVQFVTTVKSNNLADHYALFISSNKGCGWQGLCWDEHGRGQMITMPEFLTALNQITNNGDDKLDVLSIETCMTGGVEVAYQMHTCVQYFVGSPECMVANGMPYVASLNDLKSSPIMTPQAFATDIVNNFVPQDIPSLLMNTTLAATNLTGVPPITTQLDALATYFIDHLTLYKTQITTALEHTRVYAQSWKIDYYVDIYDFLEHLNINDSSYTTLKTGVETAINTAVLAKKHMPTDPCHGLSIYFPRRAGDYNASLRYPKLPSPYEATLFAQDTHWDEFLKTYLGILGNTAPAAPTITGPAKAKTGVLTNYTFVTTDPEGQHVSYFVDWGDGTNTTWTSLSASGASIVLGHTWTTKGKYIISAKARDELGAESSWGTLPVKMPITPTESRIILFGKITSLDKDGRGDFRFLPVKVLKIENIIGENRTKTVMNETEGEYPCCGYIPWTEFKGIITKHYVIGVWTF